MARFKTLTLDELEELKSEFVEFLSVQGITAGDWEKIKAEDPSRADHLVDQFSDVVYGSVMIKLKYLELRTPQELHTYHCMDQHMVLIAMESREPETDFTDPDFLRRSITTPPADLKVYTTQKPYAGNREDEIFLMLVNGCTASDGQLYETLKGFV